MNKTNRVLLFIIIIEFIIIYIFSQMGYTNENWPLTTTLIVSVLGFSPIFLLLGRIGYSNENSSSTKVVVRILFWFLLLSFISGFVVMFLQNLKLI